MVAIVSGNQLGLSLSSLLTLGQENGTAGKAGHGKAGETGYVNVATGNFVLQRQDEYLPSVGADVALLRTYNSQGLLSDDNGDNWLAGAGARRLALTGVANASGSTVCRTDEDGAQAIYNWDSSRNLYVGTQGAGAHDTVVIVGNTHRWTDGDTGRTESYDATTGRMTQSAERDGSRAVKYQYNNANGTLAAIMLPGDGGAAGESIHLDYAGTLLQRIRIVTIDGRTSTRLDYGYDASNRLATVRVDLTPENTGDAKVYTTSYTYDSNSRRIASVTETAGGANE